MKHFSITFEPDGKKISIHESATILEAAGLAGIVLNTACGGKGICKKCAVKLQGGKEVLACQYKIDSDLIVTIPVTSRFLESKILTQGIEAKQKLAPDIYKKYLKTSGRTKISGLAIDIGTTTVVLKLIDMINGDCLAVESALNPQAKHGDDVISRIAYANSEEKLTELQKLIVDCINDLLQAACERAKISPMQIYEVCVVGNTTMNHLFLKMPVTGLGQAPYKAYSIDAKDFPAKDFGIKINPEGNIHTVENIASFVGSDTTAESVAVQIGSEEKMTLIVDIGTNSEIVLGNKEKLYTASCAAGPAFEGARITCGSRAVDGAIESVVANSEDIDVDVIGNSPARSICGSGLIDAAAVLCELGIIDPTGKLTQPENLPAKISKRLTEKCSEPAFILAENNGKKVLLTQRDIRQVQLAKAAIRAGIKILERKLGIKDQDLEQVFLAGAFGNFLRKESALRIGLLPSIPQERIHFIGNAACSGAQMILLNSTCRKDAGKLAKKIEHIETARENDFTSIFTDSMAF